MPSGDPAETDYTAVGCAVTTISSNLTEMSKGVKLLAALMDDEGGNGQHLLGAAKNLACAVSDMLKTAQPTSTEVRQPAEPWTLHVVSELFAFQLISRFHDFCVHNVFCPFSLVRICSRLQETWGRPVENCCPTLGRLTLILSSRCVSFSVCHRQHRSTTLKQQRTIVLQYWRLVLASRPLSRVLSQTWIGWTGDF